MTTKYLPTAILDANYFVYGFAGRGLNFHLGNSIV
jgi:hypothetical protein